MTDITPGTIVSVAVVGALGIGAALYWMTPARMSAQDARYPFIATYSNTLGAKEVTIELRLLDGGKICGPAGVVGWSGVAGKVIELTHIPAGQCIGGKWPKWVFPAPTEKELGK